MKKQGWRTLSQEQRRAAGAKGGSSAGANYRKGGEASKGFAAMDPARLREIASRGGKNSKPGKKR